MFFSVPAKKGNLLERSSITFAANSRDDTGPIFSPSYTCAVFIAKRLVFTFINYASKIPFFVSFFSFFWLSDTLWVVCFNAVISYVENERIDEKELNANLAYREPNTKL